MTMSIVRIGDLNLIYKCKEIMENIGFSSGNYQVLDGFPNETSMRDNNIWPTITVEVDMIRGRAVELGSKEWPTAPYTIDVYARTDSQRDDICFALWNELNENIYTLYDFNEGFPSSVGGSMYDGISSLGSWGAGRVVCTTLLPDPASPIVGEKHHAFLVGSLELPNL